MAVEKQTVKVSLTCADRDKHFFYKFSDIALNAGDDAIFELGCALNSLQDTPAERIIKTVESILTFAEE